MCFNSEVSMGLFVFGMLVTFIMTIVIAMKTHKRGGKPYGGDLIRLALVFAISFMQLNEYFIHESLKKNYGQCGYGPDDPGHQASYHIITTLMIQLAFMFIVMTVVQTTTNIKNSDMIIGSNTLFTSNFFGNKSLYERSEGYRKFENGMEYYMKDACFGIYIACFSVYLIGAIYIYEHFKPEEVCSVRSCENNCRLRWDVLTKLFEDTPVLAWMQHVAYLLAIFVVCLYIRDISCVIIFIVSLLASFLYTREQEHDDIKGIRPDYAGSFWCFLSVILSTFLAITIIISISFPQMDTVKYIKLYNQ